MIKLYNHSKISDDIILPILRRAYKLAELKGKIVVVITRGRNGGGKFYRSRTLAYKPYFKSRRFIKSDLGFVVINPKISFRGASGALFKNDELDFAEDTCKIILHEFKHASDYMKGVPFTRTEQYRKRPHEISARFFAEYEVKIDDELVLNLAIELERITKK